MFTFKIDKNIREMAKVARREFSKSHNFTNPNNQILGIAAQIQLAEMIGCKQVQDWSISDYGCDFELNGFSVNFKCKIINQNEVPMYYGADIPYRQYVNKEHKTDYYLVAAVSRFTADVHVIGYIPFEEVITSGIEVQEGETIYPEEGKKYTPTIHQYWVSFGMLIPVYNIRDIKELGI